VQKNYCTIKEYKDGTQDCYSFHCKIVRLKVKFHYAIQLSSRSHTSSRTNQLRQLRPVVKSITENAAKMVVQAFISSRLDYCNSLLCGIAGNLLQKLQSVQNAAA